MTTENFRVEIALHTGEGGPTKEFFCILFATLHYFVPLSTDRVQLAHAAGGEPEGVRGKRHPAGVEGDQPLLHVLLLAHGGEAVGNVAGSGAAVCAAEREGEISGVDESS